MQYPRDLLGPECSVPGYVLLGPGVRAYVQFRGVLIAAIGTDEASASAALVDKVVRFLPQLREMKEIPAVDDVHLVQQQQGSSELRYFAKPMDEPRALLELDLGLDGALLYREADRRTYAVVSRGADGMPQRIRLGGPVHGDDGPRPLPIPGRTPSPEREDALRKDKAARIRSLLRCPLCRGVLSLETFGMRCEPCARDYQTCGGRPVLTVDPAYDPTPRDKLVSKNTYGPQVLELIERNRDGLVLDMGSGSPSIGFYNVVHLDLSAYDQVDVVTDGRRLPFADQTFDAVLSEAVLEHVPDPDVYMAELARVLKPGGRARVDVAFLQPYHAYPDHYFNMTKSGLCVTVERAGLGVLRAEVGEHQEPWVALGMLMAGFVHGTPDPQKRDALMQRTIGATLEQFARGDGTGFRDLAPEQVERLAAGFSCLCEKPVAATTEGLREPIVVIEPPPKKPTVTPSEPTTRSA
ncbi:MAG: class I SAM-dependent methyltransferase [Planctomycetota bacterium]